MDKVQGYLDEFVFRHNRLNTCAAAFQILLDYETARSSTGKNKFGKRRIYLIIHNSLGFAETTRY